MDQKMIDLYDEYTRGSMDRREFLKRLSVLAGSLAAAVGPIAISGKESCHGRNYSEG